MGGMIRRAAMLPPNPPRYMAPSSVSAAAGTSCAKSLARKRSAIRIGTAARAHNGTNESYSAECATGHRRSAASA